MCVAGIESTQEKLLCLFTGGAVMLNQVMIR
jgi:hypothetical protein